MKVSANTKIMIVDDNIVERNVAKQLLEKKGFKNIVNATNGKEAVDLLNNQHKDTQICLVDWKMPEMDGLELLKTVRAQNHTKHIIFIMMTSVSDRERVIEAIGEGVDEYLVKPYPPAELYRKITHAIKIHNKQMES